MLVTNPHLTRPVLRYLGGKWRLASWIIAQFPPHECYVEPFAGGASILLRKPVSPIEVLNDLDSEIINFFDVLRARSEDLIQAIQLTPYSREILKRAELRASVDPLERALNLYIRSWQGFGLDTSPRKTGWRYQTSLAKKSNLVERDWNETGHLYAFAERLKSVFLEHDDAFQTIARFDSPNTLFYVDPPYVLSTRSKGGSKYQHELSDEQHHQLAELLHSLQGMVVLSGYDCSLYQQLYGDWVRLEKSANTNNGKAATESLWLSPQATDLNQFPLFSVKGDQL